MNDELEQRTSAAKLVQDGATQFLRSILEEVDRSEDTALRRLADGPVAELIPSALETWNNHDRNKQIIQELHDLLQRDITADQFKRLRQSPQTSVAEWLSSAEGVRFVFQGVKARGADDATAYELTRTPSASAGFYSAMSGLAIYWLAFGGLAQVPDKDSSGDLHDIEYIVLGAMSRSLATSDRLAAKICEAVAGAFEVRRSLPTSEQFAN
jgi:hypothetical protein